jgi:hypothetical protein
MVLVSYVFAVFFILAFVADRVPLIESVKEISALSKESIKTISSTAIKDSQKQRILLANSAAIFKYSLKITCLALLILIGGYLLAFVGNELGIVKISVLFGFLETVTGIMTTLMAFGSYFLLKKIYARARL